MAKRSLLRLWAYPGLQEGSMKSFCISFVFECMIIESALHPLPHKDHPPINSTSPTHMQQVYNTTRANNRAPNRNASATSRIRFNNRSP